MVMVNAAALPATLVESELFGYESGAFTGAERKGRKGKFEQADESTLFFDEIGDMPFEMQSKLLRVLQDGVFERVGAERGRNSNFRLISASNRDFQKMISEGTFRLDLYYRISPVQCRCLHFANAWRTFRSSSKARSTHLPHATEQIQSG